jgi:preprotein translocase subunit SecF
MAIVRFFPEDTKVDFVRLRFIAMAISLVFIAGSLGLAFTKGLNMGIDFTGGTMLEVRVPVEQPDLGALRSELNNLGLGAISIQEFGQADDLMIRMGEQDGGPEVQKAAIETVRTALNEAFPDGEVDYRRVEFVGPQVGDELKKQGFMAVMFSILGILVYVWFRFEWQFGVASVIALMHDALVTLGLFALTQMEFNLTTVAALLMIAGYSINDTVVVFDRIRENLPKFKKMPLDELLNLSINQTLTRTIMTSFTTLLALLALWVFGGEVIQGFVVALIFGILVGTYSSIFVAAPILMFLNVRRSGEIQAGADTAKA